MPHGNIPHAFRNIQGKYLLNVAAGYLKIQTFNTSKGKIDVPLQWKFT